VADRGIVNYKEAVDILADLSDAIGDSDGRKMVLARRTLGQETFDAEYPQIVASQTRLVGLTIVVQGATRNRNKQNQPDRTAEALIMATR